MTNWDDTSRNGDVEEAWAARTERRSLPMARLLGLLSAALGLAMLAMPGRLASLIGIASTDRSRNVIRAVGARELLVAPGLLSRERPAGWALMRVFGDFVDLVLLALALRSRRTDRRRVAVAAASVAGVTLMDLSTARRLRQERQSEDAARVARAITINRDASELYHFWRDFERLPRFMENLDSVKVLDERRSHWRVKTAAGESAEWDAEIVEDRPGELIAWRSLPGARVQHAGLVQFRPAPVGRGTEVTLRLRYDMPARPLIGPASRLFGREPGQQAGDALRRLKQVLETGEVLRSDGSPLGTARPQLLRQRPAQPIPAAEAAEILEGVR